MATRDPLDTMTIGLAQEVAQEGLQVNGMFERFDESARRILFFARYEAGERAALTLEPEHLLLGLLRESEPLLSAHFGLTPRAIAEIREELAGSSAGSALGMEVEIPVSAGSQRVMQLAVVEADSLEHARIGPEHLLLGLLRDERSVAAGLLTARGVGLARSRQAARELSAADRTEDPADRLLSEEIDRSIQRIRDALTTAIRAKDAAAAVALFGPDPVMFLLSPPLQFKGGEGAGVRGIEDWFASFDGPIEYDVRDLLITAGQTVGFCHSLVHISGRRIDGTTTDIWIRETLGLRRIDGAWRITHQHQSVPFYMDGSNRAAVDLKP